MATKNDVTAMLMDASEIVSPRRGRKAEVIPELLEVLSAVKPGKGPGTAANLAGIFGEVTKSDQSKIAQKIRNHWRQVHDDGVSIAWAPVGDNKFVAQVQHKA